MLRGKRKAQPSNDGLPIVNGQKVRRRPKFGRRKTCNASTSSGSGGGYGTFVFVYAFVLFVLIYKERTMVPADNLVMNESGTTDSVAKEPVAKATASSASNGVVTKELPIVQPAAKPPPPPPPASASASSLPYEKCTSRQYEILGKQLPDEAHNHAKISGDASFTVATLRSDYATQPYLMRNFYASDQFRLDTSRHAFFGVIVGWRDNDDPMDTLAIGSRDQKYNVPAWHSKVSPKYPNNGLPPVVHSDGTTTTRPARVLVMNWHAGETSTTSLERLKSEFKISDSELAVAQQPGSLAKSLPNLIQSHMPKGMAAQGGMVAADQPIHYLNIKGAMGADPEILEGFMPLLDRTRFVRFDYNHKGAWFEKSLVTMIEKLGKKGLVCYWNGKKETDYALWRISGCFLDHYNRPRWAEITCVNTKHADVKELAEQMEQKFLETLKKDFVF